MTQRGLTIYNKARRAGYKALESIHIAKTVEAFDALDGVRIEAEPEEENYFDVYGEPAGYTDANGRYHTPEQEREDIADSIDRLGCWYVYAEVQCSKCEQWHRVDGVGMNCGYQDPTDPIENAYVVDLMSAAIEARRDEYAYC